MLLKNGPAVLLLSRSRPRAKKKRRPPPQRAAVAGTIALCAGFWTEALACFLMLRFDFRRCRRAEPAPVAAAPAQPEQSKEERTSLLSRDEEDGDE